MFRARYTRDNAQRFRGRLPETGARGSGDRPPRQGQDVPGVDPGNRGQRFPIRCTSHTKSFQPSITHRHGSASKSALRVEDAMWFHSNLFTRSLEHSRRGGRACRVFPHLVRRRWESAAGRERERDRGRTLAGCRDDNTHKAHRTPSVVLSDLPAHTPPHVARRLAERDATCGRDKARTRHRAVRRSRRVPQKRRDM